MPNFANSVPRAINEKFGEVISVLDFGADASGATDSSSAFAYAIAAADSVAGCAIHIPRGSYKLNSGVEIASAVDAITLYGDGPATILKRGAAMAAGKGLLNISGTDIVLRNLAIDGDVVTPAGKRYGTLTGENGSDDPMHADLTRNTSIWIHPGAKRVRLENITIRHTGGYSVLIDARTADVEDVSIDSCRVEQCRPHLFGVADGDLNYGSWTGGIHYQGDCRVAAPYAVKGLSVVDCSFDRVNGACVWGHSYGFAAHHQNVTVRNCRFSYVGFHCVGFGNVLGGTNTGNTGHHVGHVHYTDTDTPVAKVLSGAFSVCLDTAGWCENLVYTGNSFNEIAGQGSDLDGLRKGVITGNSFIGCASASCGLKGIQTGATFDPGAGCDIIIANNHLENFWYGAVVLPQAQRCAVRGNHIQHPSDAAVAPISLLPLDCQASGGGPAICTDNVVTGNDITYSGSLFCVVEEQSAAFESADRNLVCGNTLHGTNAGEFKKHANSASSSRVTDTFLAIGADRYTAAEANQYPATVALLTQSSGRMRISTSVQSGARVWESLLTDANPAAVPSSFVIPKSATQDLGGQLVLKGGDKAGGGQWQDVALDNTQGYLRIWGSGSGNSCNLLLYGTDNQASLTVSHGYVSSAQGFYTESGQYNALQLTAGGAAVKGLRISTNQSGGAYASGGYLALGRDNFTTPVALSGEDLSTKFTLHYRYTTGVEDAVRFMFGGVLRMQLSSAGNLVLPGADQGEVIKVTDGYIYSGDGFYTPSSNTDCLKAPAGGVMVRHVRVTDGSVEKAGFRYSGAKLQWSSDLSNWNDFAVSVAGVTALNSLTGALSITAGTGVTITPASPTIQVSIGQSVATTAAVTFASLNPGIVFRKENSTDEGGSFNLESPNTDNYPSLYVDNFQGYVRFIGTKNAANHCPMQVWGKAGVAGLDVLAGWVQSEAGFATTSTSATAVNVTGVGGGVFADYLTANEFLKLTSKGSAPASISGSYGGFAHKSGASYWVWDGSAWAEVNFSALLPSGTGGQTLRHNGTAWVASSELTNDGSTVVVNGPASQQYRYGVAGNVAMFRANGSVGFPTAVASGDVLGVLSMRGYGTSQYHGSATARILAYAMENFTNTAGGTDLSFHVTPIGSITSAEAMRLANTGNVTFTNKVGIGTATPLYLLDIRSRGAGSQLHLSSSDADSGGYFVSNAAHAIAMSAGAAYDGSVSSWVAKSSYASIFNTGGGRIDLYTDSGLTSGSAFNPTRRLVLYPSGGLAFGNSATFTDPGDSNIVTAGWISATGGFATTGVATNIINAASGGVTAKWLIGTTSVTLAGETAANAGLSSAGQGRIYFDSTANKFKVSENGGGYVDLVGAGSSLPSGTSGQTLRHNGSSWVASAALQNDGTNITATGTLTADHVIESRGGLGKRQAYEMSDVNEMRDIGFYAAGASTSNRPSGASTYGAVLVNNYYPNTRGQLYMNTQPGNVPYLWARASATWSDDNQWQAWVRLLVEDYNGDVSVTRRLTSAGDIVTNGGRFYCDVASQPALTLKQSGTVRTAFFYDESDGKTKIARYSDAGGYVDSPFAITRASGDVTLGRVLTVAGAAGAAGLTVSAGWVQCAGGFLTSGSAADIINASSGGVTSRYLVLSAAAGTPNLSIQEGAAPALPSSGWSRIYMDSSTHKLMVSENGGTAVQLVNSLPTGSSGQTLRHNGSAWVASSTLQNDGSTVTASGAVRLSGGHLYLANNYSIYLKDTYGNDRIAITRSSDNHLYIDNVDNNGDIYLRPANSRYVIIGQGSSSNAYLIPNTAGGTNSVGTSTYPWDEVNSATYKYGNTLLINSSGQFVGLGIAMQSYACGASGFNCYSGGAWKYGRTVTLYDRDGNAMNFYGGILAS